jgi:cold shock CspA family protein
VMPVGCCLIDGEAMLPRTLAVNWPLGSCKRPPSSGHSVEKAFGFALPDDHSADLFIHRTIVAAGGLTALKAGDRIELLPVRTVAKREPG